jgi:hypothetical protein
MKTKTIFIAITIMFFLPLLTLYAQKPNLSGEWKLNKEKTVLADNQLYLAGITILLKQDSLLTSRVYENGNGEQYPFDENLSLDGKECKMFVYDMPRTTKVYCSISDTSFRFESSTIFQGNSGIADTMVAKETFKTDTEGKVLKMIFTNKTSAGEITGTNYYDKVK